MKQLIGIRLKLLSAAALIVMQACQKDESITDSLLNNDLSPGLKSKTMNMFYSRTVPVGSGVARAWVEVNKDGDPLSVGINLSEKALNNLPEEDTQWAIELPKNKGNHFYTHVLFDWNPDGHEPPGVYDVPHFDFHFYTISNDERMAIEGSGSTILPSSADYVPLNYIPIPGVVPAMGSHWIDVTSSEDVLHPYQGTFTKTFIWGSNNGEFVFWEPMITRNYLLSQPNDTIPIVQPTAYQKDGWYASDYVIKYSTHPGEYTVALINLTHNQGE